MRIFVCDIFIIYDKLYPRCCAHTRYCARHPGTKRHTEAASMRDNWMTGPRERGISRETRIAFLATRSVTLWTNIYRVLLIRLDKPQERIAYGKIGEKKRVVSTYMGENTCPFKVHTMPCFIQSTLSTSPKWVCFTNTFLSPIETFAIVMFILSISGYNSFAECKKGI